MQTRTLAGATIAMFILGTCGAYVGRAAPARGSVLASPAHAVGLVRTINTAEADVWFKKHGYAPLGQILQHRFFNGLGNCAVLSGPSSGRWQGYALSVVASRDGRHYLLSLAPRAGCGTSLFSSESGVIYSGLALGCPDSGGTAKNPPRPAPTGIPSR